QQNAPAIGLRNIVQNSPVVRRRDQVAQKIGAVGCAVLATYSSSLHRIQFPPQKGPAFAARQLPQHTHVLASAAGQRLNYFESFCQWPPLDGFRRPGFHQNQDRYFLTLGAELLRHFESDYSAHAHTAQMIGPLLLYRPDFLDKVGCDRFNAFERSLFAVKAERLQAVDRILGPEQPYQLGVTEYVAAEPRHQKQRRLRAARLNRDQRAPWRHKSVFA